MGILWKKINAKLHTFWAVLRAIVHLPPVRTCLLCKKKTFFFVEGPWARENFRCVRCGSIPRWRALYSVLETQFPGWRELKIHESSPYGAVSRKLEDECISYTQTHFFPDVEGGVFYNGVRCENLENQTFSDGVFDIVITQDVLEHVYNPQNVCEEIFRTLKDGGVHIFTVPRDTVNPTISRVVFDEDGTLVHLKDAEYHGNPIDAEGSLVITDWGTDISNIIFGWTGMKTELVSFQEEGVLGDEAIEVFISEKCN